MTLVLSTSPGFARHGSVPKRLAATGWELVRCLEPGEIEARIGEADFIVAGLLPVTATHLAAAPRLKGVLKHGVGTDNIDVAACTARGVPVQNAPGANADAVAELAIGLMFALARAIPPATPRSPPAAGSAGWGASSAARPSASAGSGRARPPPRRACRRRCAARGDHGRPRAARGTPRRAAPHRLGRGMKRS